MSLQRLEKTPSKSEIPNSTGFNFIVLKGTKDIKRMKHGYSGTWLVLKFGKSVMEKISMKFFRVTFGNVERSVLSYIICAETGILKDCILLFQGS